MVIDDTPTDRCKLEFDIKREGTPYDNIIQLNKANGQLGIYGNKSFIGVYVVSFEATVNYEDGTVCTFSLENIEVIHNDPNGGCDNNDLNWDYATITSITYDINADENENYRLPKINPTETNPSAICNKFRYSLN